MEHSNAAAKQADEKINCQHCKISWFSDANV